MLEDPYVRIIKLFDSVKEFGELAGFVINYKKTKILCKNIANEEEMMIQKLTGCEVVDKIKYLGIYVTKKNVELFRNNYVKAWDNICKDLQNWRKLKLSWIAIVK